MALPPVHVSDDIVNEENLFYNPYRTDYSDLPNTLNQRVRKYNITKVFSTVPWVFTCVDVISGTIAGVPFKFYKATDGEENSNLVFKEKLEGGRGAEKDVQKRVYLLNYLKSMGKLKEIDKTHPVYKLFHPPNRPEISSVFDLFYLTVSPSLLVGEVFWIWEKKGGSPVNIKLQSSYYMEPIKSPDGEDLWGWKKYNTLGIPKKRYGVNDVIQFKYPNPYDRFRGLSPLLSGRLSIEEWLNMKVWNVGRFSEGSIRPPLAIEYPGKILGDYGQEQEYLNRLRHSYSGFVKGHSPMIVDRKGKVKLLYESHELDFLKGQTFTREEICSILHTPPGISGIMEYANYANLSEQEVLFWTICNLPKMTQIENLTQVNLLDVYYPEVFASWDYSVVRPLKEDPIRVGNRRFKESQAAKTYRELGVSWNDIGALLENSIFESFESMESTEPVEGTPLGFVEAQILSVEVVYNGNGLLEYKASNEFLSQYCREYNRFILEPFAERWVRFLWSFTDGMVKELGKRVEGGYPFSLLNGTDWMVRWGDLTYGLFYNIFSSAAEQVYNELINPKGILESFYRTKKPSVLEEIFEADELAELELVIRTVNEKTKFVQGTLDRLNQIALTMIREGATPLEIRKALVQERDLIVASDGLTVGRTVVNVTYSNVRQVTKKRLGAVQHAWSCSLDAAVRETHGPQPLGDHGRVVLIGEVFPRTRCRFPGDPGGDPKEIINCRCTDFVTAVKLPNNPRPELRNLLGA